MRYYRLKYGLNFKAALLFSLFLKNKVKQIHVHRHNNSNTIRYTDNSNNILL